MYPSRLKWATTPARFGVSTSSLSTHHHPMDGTGREWDGTGQDRTGQGRTGTARKSQISLRHFPWADSPMHFPFHSRRAEMGLRQVAR
jgi:hypothetical protein